MNYDPYVLGENMVIDGSEVGLLRPNDNVLIEGASGTGKSISVELPTIARMAKMNMVAAFAKEEDAYRMGNYVRQKGYRTEFLNVDNPSKSTVAYDQIVYTEDNIEDIEALASAIVLSVLEKTNDDYWNTNSIQLLGGLIVAAKMLYSNAGISEVLKLFDMTQPGLEEDSLLSDEVFMKIGVEFPDCYAFREYCSWKSLPEKTRSCVRSTLKSALHAVFPETVRQMMKSDLPLVDFEQLGREKMALFIISDGSERSRDFYTNLFWSTCISQLRRVADRSPGHHLRRPIRLYFDDFACTSAIADFDKNISLFRSYGISCMILLQSQSQLETIYGADKAACIRQNCPVQLYFPGGSDVRSCELISKKMNIPFEEVMYAPMGTIFMMASGRKPRQIKRYDVFHSKEYEEYLRANGETIRDSI